MMKPTRDGTDDAGTPPGSFPESRLKVSLDKPSSIPYRNLSTTVDLSRRSSLLNCFVNLLASAHRVPSFLIMWDSRQENGKAVSMVSARILTKWFRRIDELSEHSQLIQLEELMARLERADVFLFELANGLDRRLREAYSVREDVLAAHSAIMCSWLEASPIEEIAEISDQWRQAVIVEHNRHRDMTIDAPDHQPDRGRELAWRLLQTHRLGENFARPIHRQSPQAMCVPYGRKTARTGISRSDWLHPVAVGANTISKAVKY